LPIAGLPGSGDHAAPFEDLNNTKTAVDRMRMSGEYRAEQIRQYEEAKATSDDPTHQKQMDDMIAQLKS
jgi:hypothetical protein